MLVREISSGGRARFHGVSFGLRERPARFGCPSVVLKSSVPCYVAGSERGARSLERFFLSSQEPLTGIVVRFLLLER